MTPLEKRISALEGAQRKPEPVKINSIFDVSIEELKAKIRAESSLPLEEQLENLRNRPIRRIYEGDDFWERLRPFQIRDLEIDIAERDGIAAEEVRRLREENWNACRAGQLAPPPSQLGE